jgi:DNA replication licensing factor MCM2
MSLRDHVREDDIDLAIKVVLESFLQAQKISARRSLQRSFRKYITYGEDNSSLLLHKLNELVKDQDRYMVSVYDRNNRQRPTNSIEIAKSDLEQKAKVNIKLIIYIFYSIIIINVIF